MRYAYDTEFLETGSTIDLISIGIVAEDGREYYAVNADMDHDRIKKHDWLCQNVIPHLPLTGKPYRLDGGNTWIFALDRCNTLVKPRWVIANEVRDFLLRPHADKVELWAYYGAYDHVAFAQLFGSMAGLPPGIPMFTHEIMQAIEQAPPEFTEPPQPRNQHNALADAFWNMTVLRALGVVKPHQWGAGIVVATTQKHPQ